MTVATGANEFSIERRQLYILPTRIGLLFGLIVLVLLIAAINYSNGLAYGLTFLLAALAVVSMLHTHRNVYRLRIAAAAVPPVFAGQAARFPLTLRNSTPLPRYGVRLEQSRQVAARIDIAAHSTQSAELALPAPRRGYVSIPEFKVASDFPFGLFYTWSRRLTFDAVCLVYPAPAPPTDLPASAETASGALQARQAGDDFVGQRDYQPGDSLRHVNWKAVARGQGWYTKQFGGGAAGRLWLDWEATGVSDIETGLSVLCRWVLEAERQGLDYGLRLPGQVIQPAQGLVHQHECLRALALFSP